MNEIIKQCKQNSIGTEKQCPNNPQKKNLEKKVISGALAGVLVISSFLSFQNQPFAEPTYESIKHPIAEIETYERETLYELLDQYNLTDYEEKINGTRIYHYDARQYNGITELNDTYLYSFYLNTDDNTFNEVLKSLGYNNLDDFLEKKGYLDEQNKPSIKIWRQNDKEYAISQIESKEGKKR